PNVLLLNDNGRFKVSGEESVRISTRATGGLLVDLDNDGDLDLYVSSMPAAEGGGLAKRLGFPLAGCSLFRNEGKGQFTEISAGNGACPAGFGGRSACVLDYDGDGLLDLLVGEDPLPGYNGSKTRSSRLFRNLGDLQFEDVSRKVGLPEGIPGLGVAAGDVNNDGWPDFFLASNRGGNRLFLNDGKGRFRESPGSQQLFDWPTATGDNMVCGVCLGDVNRDGLLDIVLGQHFKQPWREPVANRLYLNRGVKQGVPQYDDVTEEVGLVPLPMKAPHVELQDFDNDGWPDLLTSIVMYDGDQPHPVIFRHTGVKNGMPVFRQEALGANDFPTAADVAEKNTGKFFAKMIEDGKVIYGAPMPSADYNRDGRLDLFLANWWVERPSLLLRNETEGGHWLDVMVEGSGNVNRMGIGSRVEIYQPGQLGQAAGLVGCREIAVGYGYASAQEAAAHFGLGELKTCDVRVILPHGAGTIEKKNVEADQRVTLSR
ncbi:MAG: CRTAC1 family protein, partial [Planctomycetaceae bacterium]|nr:CRTAC1 family protein [Planctomycetaceae bacterium]